MAHFIIFPVIKIRPTPFHKQTTHVRIVNNLFLGPCSMLIKWNSTKTKRSDSLFLSLLKGLFLILVGSALFRVGRASNVYTSSENTLSRFSNFPQDVCHRFPGFTGLEPSPYQNAITSSVYIQCPPSEFCDLAMSPGGVVAELGEEAFKGDYMIPGAHFFLHAQASLLIKRTELENLEDLCARVSAFAVSNNSPVFTEALVQMLVSKLYAGSVGPFLFEFYRVLPEFTVNAIIDNHGNTIDYDINTVLVKIINKKKLPTTELSKSLEAAVRKQLRWFLEKHPMLCQNLSQRFSSTYSDPQAISLLIENFDRELTRHKKHSALVRFLIEEFERSPGARVILQSSASVPGTREEENSSYSLWSNQILIKNYDYNAVLHEMIHAGLHTFFSFGGIPAKDENAYNYCNPFIPGDKAAETRMLNALQTDNKQLVDICTLIAKGPEGNSPASLRELIGKLKEKNIGATGRDLHNVAIMCHSYFRIMHSSIPNYSDNRKISEYMAFIFQMFNEKEILQFWKQSYHELKTNICAHLKNKARMQDSANIGCPSMPHAKKAFPN
jgi:hypothetical protein